jgi:hypothetical protein
MSPSPAWCVVLVPGDGRGHALAVAAVADLVAAGCEQVRWVGSVEGLPAGCVAVGAPSETLAALAADGVPVVGVLAHGVTGPAHVLSICGAFIHEGAGPGAARRVLSQVGAPSARVLAAAASSRTGAAPAA